MANLIDSIQTLFPMSKGAFLAISILGGAGYYQASSMNESMDEIKTLQRETIKEIHAIDKRLTVVEAQLDGTIVFRSGADIAANDSMYSNPQTVDFYPRACQLTIVS